MFERLKKLGLSFMIIAGSSLLLWVIFFCLRYLIWQKSIQVGDAIVQHLLAIRGMFKNFYYFDSWHDALWKLMGWLTILYGLLMIIQLSHEALSKRRPGLIPVIAIAVFGVTPMLDFCANSGDYFYQLQRFIGNNTFYVLGLLGFLVYGAFVTGFIGAITAFGLWKNEEDPEEEAELEASKS